MTTPQKAANQTFDPSPNLGKCSCLTCTHLNVCALYRAITPLLQSWEKDKPFETTDLATICKAYFNASVQQALSFNLQEGQTQ